MVREAARLLDRPVDALNLISLHLGNGASAAAIRAGRCVDTSMGMTPLEGLVMGTRAGDLDPGVLLHLLHRGLEPEHLERQLNQTSGLRGLCGENDMRQVHCRVENGEAAARLALDAFCYRIRKYLGAYCAVLGRVDAVVFTGGIGQHDPQVRAAALQGLEALGMRLDAARNRQAGGRPGAIHDPDSAVALLVIPSREEREIARQVQELLRSGP
jgi:acetate kinase